jgi:nicotinamidase-related amidase
MKHIWDDMLSAEDLEVYKQSGFGGNPVGMGKRPAVLLIDVQNRTVGDNVPILKSIQESGYATSCGERAYKALPNIEKIMKAARKKGFPVVHVIIERRDKQDAGRWADKVPGIALNQAHRVGNKGVEIVESVKPIEGDIIIAKRYPSGFFGTHLVSQLITLEVDTVIITGATTSGCVRATAVDAFSYGFRVLVPEDGVYDRIDIVHKMNLFDINSKCGDVLSTDQIIEMMEKL